MSQLALDPNGDLEIILRNPHSAIRGFTRGLEAGTARPSDPFNDLPLKPKSMSKKEQKKKKRDRLRSQSAEDPLPPAPPADDVPPLGEPHEQEPIAEEPIAEEPIAGEVSSQGIDLEVMDDTHEFRNSVSSSGHSESVGLRLLVSSKHLCLASSTFRLMLDGPWLEGSKTKSGIRTIQASDCDAKAFVIILDIMHGNHFAMPQSVDLELLANIACVVNYYDCHEVVEPFVDKWIKALEPNPPIVYDRQCMLWMAVSWVFLRETSLISMAHLAVIGCEGHIDDMGLPLPDVSTCFQSVGLRPTALTLTRM